MSLSLESQCYSCGSKCCKTGALIGSPIISAEEKAALTEEQQQSLTEVLSPAKEKYWIIKEKPGTKNACSFLDNGKCLIEDKKPMDCLCYPVKAIYANNTINLIIDTNCPASNQLSEQFVEEAKKIALDSINRFQSETYDHWLDNYVGWVKKTEIDIDK